VTHSEPVPVAGAPLPGPSPIRWDIPPAIREFQEELWLWDWHLEMSWPLRDKLAEKNDETRRFLERVEMMRLWLREDRRRHELAQQKPKKKLTYTLDDFVIKNGRCAAFGYPPQKL